MATTEITANNAKFDAAIAAGDPARVAALYTDQARLLPPGAKEIRGRQEIENYWKAAIEGLGIRASKLTTVELEELGDVASEVGSFSLRLQSGGEPESTVTGKYVVIHRRQSDGSWLWGVDCFNFDA